MKKIKVGFVINYRLNKWLGVTFYYRNLFKTILDQKNSELELILISDRHITPDERKEFEGIKIIQTNLVDRYSRWTKYLNIILILIFGKNFFFERFLINNGINVLSHTNSLGNKSKIPSLKYIPDFQHLHYPEYFTPKLIFLRKLEIWFSSKHSSKIVLYARTVLKDLERINYNASKKVTFLPYCTNLDNDENLLSMDDLKKKYNIKNDYFYLPNHFWKHKNHIVVFKAINHINKNLNLKINLVTTGEKSDYRSPDYITYLEEFIKNNNLDKNIKHLGIVPMNDVYSLIKNSTAIINPSFFEGWGTSVEHARYFKKKVIASNLEIHLEQNNLHKSLGINTEHAKNYCYYFNPKDYLELSKHIVKIFAEEKESIIDRGNYILNHKKIVKKFYENYLEIIKTLY